MMMGAKISGLTPWGFCFLGFWSSVKTPPSESQKSARGQLNVVHKCALTGIKAYNALQ